MQREQRRLRPILSPGDFAAAGPADERRAHRRADSNQLERGDDAQAHVVREHGRGRARCRRPGGWKRQSRSRARAPRQTARARRARRQRAAAARPSGATGQRVAGPQIRGRLNRPLSRFPARVRRCIVRVPLRRAALDPATLARALRRMRARSDSRCRHQARADRSALDSRRPGQRVPFRECFAAP